MAALGVTNLASATGSSASAHKTTTVKRVFFRGGKRNLRLIGPKSVREGDKLKIINKTDPHAVGPHTFSLVVSPLIPRTHKAENNCFRPSHICREIFGWHQGGAHGGVPINPVRAAKRGWNREGDLDRRGDSWFTGKQNQSFKQVVSAEGGAVIHYMCAVHPFLHGSFVVKP